ncbi:uncharacterized protein UDID_17521 [Ustilago sp. UG-2017a]|nr:uncharacterized protein UDID_17521 [Ustilago sp. UG-2017a]
MSVQRQCPRCKHSCGPDSFVGKNGRIVKTCSTCRNVATHNTAGIRPAFPIATNPSTRSCSHSPSVVDRSSSTPAAHSHQSSFSSAAETVLDGIDSRIGRLEDTIHLNFATILTRIDSLQSSHHPPSTPTSPAAVTSQPPLPGELVPPSSLRVFPWVLQEVISQVVNDTLKLERLILLHNPKSRISKETPAQAGLVFADGQVKIAEESSKQRSSSFAKVIPNIRVLAQIYSWKGVTEYHLAICRQCFGTGVTHKWAHTDTTLQGRTLLTNFRTPTAPSSSIPSSKPGAKSSRPSHTTTNPPPVKIYLTFVPTATKNILSNRAAPATGSSHPHQHHPEGCIMVSLHPHSDDVPRRHVARTTHNRALPADRAMSTATTSSGPAVTLLPASSSSGSGLADTMLSAFSPPGSGLVDTLLPASSSSGPGLADTLRPASSSLGSGLTGRVFPVASLGSGLVDWKLSATLPSTPRAPSASRAMLVPSLDFFAPQGIADMLSDSASTLLVSLLTDPAPPARPDTACELPIFDRSNTPATVGSLKLEHWAPFLDLYPDQDFANQLRGALRHGALLGYSGPLHDNTRLEGSNLPMDSDDELHLCDARLMGFHLDGLYYQECALAFGGHSSPFLFNLFAESLRWVSHYLDNFFCASDPAFNTSTPIQVLSIAAAALGFRLSCKKTVWSTTRLEILGIELNSVAQTASITDQHRQRILQLWLLLVTASAGPLVTN